MTCGAGLQTRTVICRATATSLQAPEALCTATKPIVTQLCPSLPTCPRTVRDAEECKDDLEHCPAWFSLGECTKGGEIQKWMHENCKRSCGVCGARILESSSASTSTSGCVDHDAQCPKWATLGECSGPSGSFVKNACPKSCNACTVARRGQYARLQVDEEGEISKITDHDTPAPIDVWPADDSSSADALKANTWLVAAALVSMLALLSVH